MGNLIKKILIAPNSYKESLDSVSVTELLHDYLHDARFELHTLPLSDGGDGFLNVCKARFSGNKAISGVDTEKFIYNPELKKVYIESAELIGLKIIPLDQRNPLKLNSHALGDILQQLKKKSELKEIDIEEVVIGVGGTATMDMGLGAACSFGLKLFNDNDNELNAVPSEFIKVRRVSIPDIILPFSITVVNDVSNPLLGVDGGLRIYGPQKGAALEDIDLIERGIKNILSLISADEDHPGAGGGLSAGLSLFFKAKMKTSEQFILHDLGLKEYIDKVDYVITGEGKFDNQSFYNKAAGLVIKTFKNIPVFLCCGIIENYDLPDNVIPIELSRYFTSQNESISNTPSALKLAAEVIKSYINLGSVS